MQSSGHLAQQGGYNAAAIRRDLHVRFFLPTLALGLAFLFAPAAWSQSNGSVKGWGSCAVAAPPPIPAGEFVLNTDELEVISGRVEFELQGNARFTDDIMLRSGNRSLSAGAADYDQSTGVFSVSGEVEFRDPDTRVKASSASYDQRNGRVNFTDAEFQVWSVPARGQADEIRLDRAGKASLKDVTYTSCPEGNDDWLVEAGEISLDQEVGIGIAKDAKFRIRGIPVMYVPYISYPITNQRKTGWLIPDLGSSQQRGLDVSAPWYWNIAPNLDATLIPRYMSRRGLQMGGEFRYLTEQDSGTWTGQYLYDDDATGEQRWLLDIAHSSLLPRGFRGSINALGVSDSGYFEDFSSSLASTSQTHLLRRADLEYLKGPWRARLSIEGYQTIDATLTPEQEPYTRLPQLYVSGYQPNGLFGLAYGVQADVTYFDRKVGVQGLRAHLALELSRPFSVGIVDIDPRVSLEYTRYNLSDTTPGEDDKPSRTTPITSIDMKSTFERLTRDSKWVQTLEPRVLYTYIPFREQSDLPVFDTIEPDLNIVQLFRRNRFIGYDRLADANQLAVGVSTRLIGAGSGEEFLRATLGQVRYLSEQRVTLPDGLPNDSSSSDYLAELGVRFAKYWRTDLNFQWDSDQSETRRAEARVQYRRDERRIANLSYRFRRDSLENIDVAVAWPIAQRWNFVGRYNFSLEANEPLERFAGVEYETCCWAVRTVWRRFLARRTGESDTSFSVQFVLKGFSDSGTAAEDMLGRDILSYL